MELAPVLTGLALAGRVGANIAAELGTMRVTEQIDALETLGYEPHAYLVVPRVIAGVIMFPVVVGAAMLVGVSAGWIASIALLDLSSAQFVKGLRLFFDPFVRGVQSGRIEAISLTEGGWVQMRLKLDEAVTLPRDPVVLLNAASLFGEWQATVTSREALPLNPDVRRQIDEAEGDREGLPGAMVPDIAQLTAVAGGIAGNIASVAERFKVAFDDTAAVELRGSIANAAQLSAELARTVRRQSRNVDSIALDVHGGMVELRTTAEAIRRVAERLDSSTAKGEVRSHPVRPCA